MARTTTADRVINGVEETGTVWLDLVRTGNDRMYRLNRLLLDEAERTQDERSALLKQLVTAPTEVTAFANSLFQTLSTQSRRRLNLARTVVNDIRDVSQETRTLIGRAADANRNALQATAAAGRQAAGRVVREAATAVEEAADRVEIASERVVKMADRAANGTENAVRQTTASAASTVKRATATTKRAATSAKRKTRRKTTAKRTTKPRTSTSGT